MTTSHTCWRKILVIAICGLLVSARAQASGSDDWSRVRYLPPRTEIEIVLRSDAVPFHGYFLEADDSRMMVSDLTWNKTQAIARADVTRITALTKPSTGSIAAKGGAVGTMVGLLTGAMTVMAYCKTNSCDSQGGLPLVIFPVWGLAFGSGVGALVGHGLHNTWTEIYGATGNTVPQRSAAARPQLFASNARPHADTAVSFTRFTLNSAEPSDRYFTNSGDGIQVRAGLYVTRHFKSEFEWTSATMMGSYGGYVDTPAYLDDVQLRRWDNFDRYSLTQLYELRSGGWWRPYVGAGVAFDTETRWQTRNDYTMPPLTAAERLANQQSGHPYPRTDPYPPASALPNVTTTDVRGYARAGFKLHFGRQGLFLLTEVQAGGGDRFAPLRIGLGADLF